MEYLNLMHDYFNTKLSPKNNIIFHEEKTITIAYKPEMIAVAITICFIISITIFIVGQFLWKGVYNSIFSQKKVQESTNEIITRLRSTSFPNITEPSVLPPSLRNRNYYKTMAGATAGTAVPCNPANNNQGAWKGHSHPPAFNPDSEPQPPPYTDPRLLNALPKLRSLVAEFPENDGYDAFYLHKSTIGQKIRQYIGHCLYAIFIAPFMMLFKLIFSIITMILESLRDASKSIITKIIIAIFCYFLISFILTNNNFIRSIPPTLPLAPPIVAQPQISNDQSVAMLFMFDWIKKYWRG